MKYLFVILILFLTACTSPKKSSVEQQEFRQITLKEMPDDLDYSGLVKAIRITIERISRRNTDLNIGDYQISSEDYILALTELMKVLDQPISANEKQRYIQNHFIGVQAKSERGWGEVFVTGYYSPIIQGRMKKTRKYSEPLYVVPDDMVKIDIDSFYEALPSLRHLGIDKQIRDGKLRGRIVQRDGQSYVVPYLSRREIASKRKIAKVLCYVDPVDAFFMQIQGSGEVQIGKNRFLKINYADQNGHSYYAIGKALLDKIPIEEMSMQRIEAYLRSVPKKEAQQIMNLNPSYVFFQISTESSLTSYGVEAQAGRTIATDGDVYPKGLLAFLNYPNPDNLENMSSQFVFNHDSGGAIRGPGRVDLYWGKGDTPEKLSGGLKGEGMLTFLIPKINKKSRDSASN